MASSNNSEQNDGRLPLRRQSTIETFGQSNDSKSMRNSMLAGYIAGVAGIIAGFPLDSAKVLMQTGTKTETGFFSSSLSSKESSAAANFNASNIRSAARSMSSLASSFVPNEKPTMVAKNALNHIRRLYKGIASPLLSVGVVQSVNFATYDTTRRTLYGMDYPDRAGTQEYLNHDSLTNVGIAALASGSVLAVIQFPMMVVKTKQQAGGIDFKKAVTDSLYSMTHAEGKRSFAPGRMLIGFGPHAATEIGGKGLYFVSYENVKRLFAARNPDQESNTLMQRIIASVVAGSACWITVYPLDSIRCRIWAQKASIKPESNERFLSSGEIIKQMWQDGKVGAFYRGFGVTLMRAGPVAAVILPIYDISLEQLNKL